MNLNERDWKDFKIENILNVSGSITTHPSKLIKNGSVPRITCSSEDNGFDDTYKNKATEKGHVLTVDSATIGTVFYQEVDFIATDHVEKITLPNTDMNRYIGLFLKTAIENATSNKYGYGYKFSQNRIKTQIISLPVDENGNPDYNFMESYMREKENKMLLKYKKFIENRIPLGGVTTSAKIDWKPVKIENLFNIYTGGDLILSKIKNGNIPIVSHSNVNNGIAAWTKEIHGRKLFNHSQTISLADRGNFSAKYQLFDFYIGTRVKALEYKEKASKELLMFIANQINMQGVKFSYGHNACDNIGIVNIMLPIKKDGKINKEYIENFMKTIEYNKIKKYISLKY